MNRTKIWIKQLYIYIYIYIYLGLIQDLENFQRFWAEN